MPEIDCEMLQEALGYATELDIAVVGVEFSLHGLAIFAGSTDEVLIAGEAVDFFHKRDTELSHCSLRKRD